MRKNKSDFDSLCKFLNTIDIGTTYKTKDMIRITGSNYNSMGATVSRYQTILKRLNFIEHSKHGEWKVNMHIPDWFTSSYAYFLLGNYRWDNIRHKYVDTIYGMTKDQVLEKLKCKNDAPNKFTAHPMYNKETGLMGHMGVSGVTGYTGSTVTECADIKTTEIKTTFTLNSVIDKYAQLLTEFDRIAKIKEAKELENITVDHRLTAIEKKITLLESERLTNIQYTEYLAKNLDDLLFFLEKTAENLLKYITEIRKNN